MLVFDFFQFIGSMVLIYYGANFLIKYGKILAISLGVSPYIIGLTIIALGTSLPELTSSIIAAKKGHGEMAIGNIFGSNIFNILMVIGIASTIHPLSIEEKIYTDLIFTTILTCLMLLLIRIGYVIKKQDGIILCLCYGSYMGLKGMGLL